MTNEPEKWSNIDEVTEHLGVYKDLSGQNSKAK
jgi:hypothetical protein